VTRPTATRVAWSSWAASLMLGLFSVALLVLTRATPIPRGAVPRGVNAGWGLLLLAILSTMGALIVARQPANRIGWSFVAAGLGLALQAFATQYAIYALLTDRGALPGAAWLAWLSSWLTIPPIYSAFAALLLLFPSGRLLSPRWRPVAWMVVSWIVGVAVGNFSYPPDPYLGVEAPVRLNEAAGQIMNTIGSLAWLLVALALPAAAASLVVRFRRSRGQERQQLKWLAFAAALLGVGLLGIGLVDILEQLGWVRPQSTRPVGAGLGGVAILGVTALPVTAGLAVLKYRLYEIDPIINRTLVYGLLTALLAAVYAGLVLSIGQLSGAIGTEPPSGAVAGATLAVAALFQPARRRIQAVVDRRFNRRKYNAAQTIQAFSTRLREQVDLDTLSSELLAVVDQTMAPTQVWFWLRPSPPGSSDTPPSEARPTTWAY
jgi:MFS family permease